MLLGAATVNCSTALIEKQTTFQNSLIGLECHGSVWTNDFPFNRMSWINHKDQSLWQPLRFILTHSSQLFGTSGNDKKKTLPNECFYMRQSRTCGIPTGWCQLVKRKVNEMTHSLQNGASWGLYLLANAFEAGPNPYVSALGPPKMWILWSRPKWISPLQPFEILSLRIYMQ